MRTEQQVYEELLQLESDLECKLHDVKTAIKVLHGLSWPNHPTKDRPIKEHVELPPPKAPRSLNEKTCQECGLLYTPTSNVQKRCEECRSKKVNKPNKPPE